MINKRLTAVILVLIVILILGNSFFKFWHDAGEDSRRIQNDYILRSLATGIELYWEKTGRYPNTISNIQLDLKTDKEWLKGFEEAWSLAQSNIWQDLYCYKPSTNGFTIIVTGPDFAPAGWFGKHRSIEKKYNFGENTNRTQ